MKAYIMKLSNVWKLFIEIFPKPINVKMNNVQACLSCVNKISPKDPTRLLLSGSFQDLCKWKTQN